MADNMFATAMSTGDPNYKRRIAAALMRQGIDTSPVQHWSQGLARMAQAYVGGQINADLDEKTAAADREGIAMLLNSGNPPPTAPQPQMNAPSQSAAGNRIYSQNEMSPLDAAVATPRELAAGAPAQAISGIESGGRYDAIGPQTKYGRAYGKYQVLDSNIGPWTRDFAGREMTPQEFLADPQAQDRVFQGQFGKYTQQYGSPEAASRAWFAGPGNMNNMNARDNLGTSVADYSRKFVAGGGDPSALPQNATPTEGYYVPGVGNVSTALMPASAPQDRSRIMMALALNPHMSPAVKQMLIAQASAKPNYHTVDGTLLRIDQQGNAVPVYRSQGKPEFREIEGEDGNRRPYWVNPQDRSITSATPPGQPQAGPSVIPPVPSGVDPKEWRRQHSERKTRESMPASYEEHAKMRGEIQGLPSYKNMAQAAPVYRSMVDAASRDDRAADVNMIYGLAKIMDPGSVVRESEMTVAQAIATLPEQWRATIESQLAGNGRLAPGVRAAIMREARSRIQAYQQSYDMDRQFYRGVAGRNRINSEDAIPDFGEFPEWSPPAPPAGQQIPGAAAAPLAPEFQAVPGMPGVSVRVR